jgi:hypothetical protein
MKELQDAVVEICTEKFGNFKGPIIGGACIGGFMGLATAVTMKVAEASERAKKRKAEEAKKQGGKSKAVMSDVKPSGDDLVGKTE